MSRVLYFSAALLLITAYFATFVSSDGPIIITIGKKSRKHGDLIIFAGHGHGKGKKGGHGEYE